MQKATFPFAPPRYPSPYLHYVFLINWWWWRWWSNFSVKDSSDVSCLTMSTRCTVTDEIVAQVSSTSVTFLCCLSASSSSLHLLLSILSPSTVSNCTGSFLKPRLAGRICFSSKPLVVCIMQLLRPCVTTTLSWTSVSIDSPPNTTQLLQPDLAPDNWHLQHAHIAATAEWAMQRAYYWQSSIKIILH